MKTEKDQQSSEGRQFS